MERCNITFSSAEVGKKLRDAFNEVNKRRECIRPECKLFSSNMPSDIIISFADDNPISTKIYDVDTDLKKSGKIIKHVTYNNDGSAYIELIGTDGALSPTSKRCQNEMKRIQSLLQNTKCPNCDIVNNFELYGEEICKKLGYTYSFVGMGEINNAIVLTAMTSEGSLGKINGKEARTGIFKEALTNDEIMNCFEILSNKNFDVCIFVTYEYPKFTPSKMM